jgi:hypothetical protein
MVQISIKKQEQITNQASFPTMEEAQAWISYHEGMKSFGQPKQVVQQQVELSPAVLETQQVLVKEAELDEEGNELSPAEFEEQEVVIQEAVSEMQEVELPGDYEVVIEDISAKLEQEKSNAEAQAFLDESDWKVLRHRDQQDMGLATSLTGEEFQALLQQRQMAREAIIK